MKRKLLSLALALSMLLTLAPPVAYATASEVSSDDGASVVVQSETVTLGDADWDSDELFAGYVDRLFSELSLQSSGQVRLRAFASNSAKNRLSTNGQAAYDIILAAVNNFLSNSPTSRSTVFDISSAGMRTSELENLVYALKMDQPYKMFWFSNSYSYSFNSSTSVVMSVSMQVSASYQAGSYNESALEVTSDLSKVTTALNNAATIISSVQALGIDADKNYSKLKLIKKEICDRVTYNTSAAGGGVEYGDPWQIIYVFDNDPSTDVVCEGYAKAFQYLCENAELTNATSYIVTGDMGGAHMWNVVTMEDGKNYLVDVTNCDGFTRTDTGVSYSSGYPDRLFLVGASGSVNGGYTVSMPAVDVTYTYNGNNYTATLPANTVSYAYDDTTKALTPESVLALSGKDYTPAATLSGIAVSGSLAEQTALAAFDPTGFVVTATYSDGSTKVLAANEYTVTVTGAESPLGTFVYADSGKTLTVSYTEGGVTKTATTDTVTVKQATQVLTLSSSEVTVKVGNKTLNLSGLVSRNTDEAATITYALKSESSCPDGTSMTDAGVVTTGTSATGDFVVQITAGATTNYSAVTTPVELTVKVVNKDAANVTISGAPSGNKLTYGQEVTLTAAAASHSDSGATWAWTSGTTEAVDFDGAENAASAKLKAKGVGTSLITVSYSDSDYAGTAGVTITVEPKTLTGSMVTLGSATETYTGSAITPTVTVTDGSTALTANTDYTVEYSSNVNAGTATVTATGKGNYTGTVQKTFTITAKPLAANAIGEIAAQTYTGSAITPEPTVKDGEKTLTKNIDYEVSYSTNVNAGTATVTATGKGNYSGTASKTFTINPKSIAGAVIADIPAQTYTGSAITPLPVVTDGGTTLVRDTDYTVSYSANTAAGTATVTVTGKGNYSGTASKTFTIGKAQRSIAVTVANVTFGTPVSPSVTYTPAGANGGDVTYTYYTAYTSANNNTSIGTTAPTAVGTYYVVASVVEGDNYAAAASAAAQFTISAATIPESVQAGVTAASGLTYSGAAQDLVTVDTSATSDYTLTYSTTGADASDFAAGVPTGTNAGSYNVWAKISKDGYTPVVKALTPSIAQASLTVTGSGTATAVKGTALNGVTSISGLTVKLGESETVVPGTWAFTETTVLNTVGEANYTAKFTPASDAANYSNGTTLTAGIAVTVVDVSFYISDGSTPATAANVVTITDGNRVYGNTWSTIITGIASGLTAKLDTSTDDTAGHFALTIDGVAYATASGTKPDAGEHTYAVTYSGTLSGHEYTNVQVATGTITIARAEIAAPTAVTGPLTYNGTEQTGVTDPAASAGYTLTGNKAANAGSYTAVATPDSNHKWSDDGTTAAKNISWSIGAASLSGATVTLSATSLTFNGAEQTVGVSSVTLGGGPTVTADDYYVSGNTGTDAGTYTVTVTGTGNFTGNATKTFTIDKKPLTIPTAVWSTAASLPYTGSEQTYPAPTVTGLPAELEMTVTGNTGTAVNSYTASAAFAFKSGYKADNYILSGTTPQNKKWAIVKAAPTITASDKAVQVGGIVALSPTLSVAAAGWSYLSSNESVATVDSNGVVTGVAAGTATITIGATVSDATNYNNPESKVVTITVTTKQVPVITVSAYNKPYAGEITASALGATAKVGDTAVPGTWSFVPEVNPKDVAEARDYTLKFTPTDGETYEAVTTAVSVTITPADLSGATVSVSPSSYTYDGGSKTPAVTVTMGGRTLSAGTDYDLSGDTSASGTGSHTVTATGKGNYTGAKTGSFTITAATGGGGGGGGSAASTTTTSTTDSATGVTTTTTKETKSDGTVVETAKSSDGTTAVTETKRDGTVTETVTTAAGDKTETVTKPDGSSTETTTSADGTEIKTETAADGSSTVAGKDANGTTASAKTDADGNLTEASATVTAATVEAAVKAADADSGEKPTVTLPVEVPAAASAESAAEIKIDMPATVSADAPVKVEIPVEDVKTTTVVVIVREDGTEELVKDCTVSADGVVLGVEGNVTVKVIDNTKTFSDSIPDWAADEVNFVTSREIFNGNGNGTFSANQATSRGMIAQVLFNFDRESGSGTVSGTFGDAAGKWYDEAASWASGMGVVQGSFGQFNGDAEVSRQDLATMLYRYADARGFDTAVTGTANSFSDAASVAGYAADAMQWAVEKGVINGMDGALKPTGSATRGQVAAMMARFVKNVAN